MTQSEIDFFDRLAPEWDANEILSTPEHVKDILGKLPIERGMEVLDLGTGTGVLIPYLSKMVGSEGHVTAIDLSEGMLKEAIRKYGNLDNVEFLRLDFEEEELPGVYDVVMMYCVYPHLHSPYDTMHWLFKMNMRKEGIIVISFPSDERYINEIHHDRKSESDHLPPATVLAERLCLNGFKAEVMSATEDEYIVIVRE